MKKIIRNLLIIVACVAALLVVVKFITPENNYRRHYEGYDLTDDVGNVGRKNTYRSYITRYADKGYPAQDVPVDIFAYDSDESTGVSIVENYKGAARALMTEDGSAVTWIVDVPVEGLYNIQLDYIATPSRNVDMERIVYVNGELPFEGADTLVFSRLWHDGAEISYDNRGNQIRPTQAEYFDWQKAYCCSELGYEIDPYCFYFEAGENTLTIEATNEPMVLRGVTVKAVQKTPSYKEYTASLPKSTAADNVEAVKLQGEETVLRSDPSLFGRYDRASATTEPYDVSKIILNYIGGDSWKTSGQWIQWDYDAPADGYYKISIRGRQMYQRGSISNRSLYIDDEIPFTEVNTVGFNYSTDWKQIDLADENGKPYEFYMTKGKHSIRLEVTLGGMGPLINQLEDSIYRLNVIYRTFLVLTGANPDVNRDYNLQKVYPETVEAMNLESKRLYKIVDDFIAYTGQESDKIAPAKTLAIDLEEYYKKPYKITKTFNTFKDNITALGTSLLELSESKLDIDYIIVTGRNASVPSVKTNFLKKAGHSIKSYVSSYTGDSTNLGNVYDKKDKDVISAWIVSGRDQSTVLKNMIDDTFTPRSGVKVNLKLIDINSLLSAVVAGNGPDVVISCDSGKPVEYAMRHADEDLTQFPDCDEVLAQFYPSAYRRYQYEDGVYALPETETFSLLFYRKDILAQLGLEVPETWDDVIAMLPTLQGNKLEFGVQCPSVQNPTMGVFYSMLYQKGGDIYNETLSHSILDNEEGIAAFKLYTSLYVNYGLPVDFDFVNRFRSGQMPIGIADYTTYNSLAVAAPEIRGLWEFTYIPGELKVDEDGAAYIERKTNADGVNCMMIRSKNETVKQNTWKFMKWWVSAETQLRFGRELEAILGASGRYATANKSALKQLSWSTKQLTVLENSLENSFAVPECPGSYYTSRHCSNAIRKVINEKEEPREVLIDYTRKINEELTRKREEFKLPTYEDEIKNGGKK